jgi:phage terminase small subunit
MATKRKCHELGGNQSMAPNRGRVPQAAKAVTFRVDGKPERLLPPSELSTPEKTVWVRLVSSCEPGHFRDSDFPLLTAYCQLISQRARAAKELRAQGDVIDGKINPLIVVVEKCDRGIIAYSMRLRLAPQSRAPYAKKSSGPPMSVYEQLRMQQGEM